MGRTASFSWRRFRSVVHRRTLPVRQYGNGIWFSSSLCTAAPPSRRQLIVKITPPPVINSSASRVG
jgi:hypothetical protein